MERARVICHMYTTIDGKINTELPAYPESADCDYAGEVYDNITHTYGEAWGCGRQTFQNDNHPDLADLDTSHVRYQDHIIQGKNICFAFDRYGKVFWEHPYNEYAGWNSPVVEVLTRSVHPEFVVYLDSIGCGYMFCGQNDLDLEEFLTKIARDYGVKTFMLCGGPAINAEFMRRDLVDEISLIVCPGVQGGRRELTSIGSENLEGFPRFFTLDKAEILPHSTLHLIYKR